MARVSFPRVLSDSGAPVGDCERSSLGRLGRSRATQKSPGREVEECWHPTACRKAGSPPLANGRCSRVRIGLVPARRAEGDAWHLGAQGHCGLGVPVLCRTETSGISNAFFFFFFAPCPRHTPPSSPNWDAQRWIRTGGDIE